MPRVDFPLYLVTDRHQTAGRPLLAALAEALGAGAPALQLREKDLHTLALLGLAEEVLRMARASRAKLLINDRIDLVMALGADGVHLRSSSLTVAVARRILGEGPLIGVSAHTVEEVIRAESEGADFAVLGPVYRTPSKLGYGRPIGTDPLQEAARHCRIPIFAIGGITVSRVREVCLAGAYGVAVISSVLAAESISDSTRSFLHELAAKRQTDEQRRAT